MKDIFIVYGACGTIFLDKDLELLSYWHENDADYRPEYMERLFNYAGANMVELDIKSREYDDMEVYLTKNEAKIAKKIKEFYGNRKTT